MIEINKNAPIYAAGEIEIATNPEIIWDIMADIDNWPDWNPDIKWTYLKEGLDVGSEFRWKSGPSSIKSTMRDLNKPHMMAWTGKTLGIYAIHVWNLESSNGHTVVKSEESWDGLIAHLFSGMLKKMLERAIKSGLLYLKIEAEKRTKLQ